MSDSDLYKILNDTFASDSYNTARVQPSPEDPLYFHFQDLLLAIKGVEIGPDSAIIDYGCGSSPYQSQLKYYLYHRADYIYGDIKLDFEIKANKLPDTPSDFYDIVLSTQVLEHVGSVSDYLAEAHRVLKNNGRLILSTHGLFEDHACPYDYWRWTAEGLKCEIERSGFRVKEIYKLTSGKRLAAMLLGDSLNCLYLSKNGIAKLVLKVMRKLFTIFRAAIISQIENESKTDSIFRVTDNNPGPTKYVAIMVVAKKDT